MPAPRWKAHEAWLIEQTELGARPAELAEHFQVSPGAMSMVLTRLRAEGKLGRAKNSPLEWSEAQKARLRAWISAGKHGSEFAEQEGLCPDSVYKACRELGLRPPPRYAPVAWRDLLPEFRRRRLGGQSCREIAQDLGVSATGVLLRCREEGFERRKKGRAKPQTALPASLAYPETLPGAQLWNEALAAIPRNIRDPGERRDICQEVCVEALEHPEEPLSRLMSRALRRVRGPQSEPGLESLDRPLSDGFCLLDLLAS